MSLNMQRESSMKFRTAFAVALGILLIGSPPSAAGKTAGPSDASGSSGAILFNSVGPELGPIGNGPVAVFSSMDLASAHPGFHELALADVIIPDTGVVEIPSNAPNGTFSVQEPPTETPTETQTPTETHTPTETLTPPHTNPNPASDSYPHANEICLAYAHPDRDAHDHTRNPNS